MSKSLFTAVTIYVVFYFSEFEFKGIKGIKGWILWELDEAYYDIASSIICSYLNYPVVCNE